MNHHEILQAGIAAAKAGGREKAVQLFANLVQLDPQSEPGWLYLGHCVTTPEKKVYCYRRVLDINPKNPVARQKLSELTAPKLDIQPGIQIQQTGQTPPKREIAPGKQAHQTNSQSRPIQIQAKAQPAKRARSKQNKGNTWMIASAAILLLLLCGMASIYLLIWKGMAAPWAVPTATHTPNPTTTITPTATPALSPTPTPKYISTFEEAACSFSIPAGVKVTCGFVLVPENREGDLSHKIRLAVAVFHAKHRKQDAVPILFLQGGPGSGAVEWSAELYPTFVEPLIQNRDFIFFDQRGSGLSTPSLDCPELTETYLQDLSHLLPGEQREAEYTKALLGCHDRLTQAGVDLGSYTTLNSAADVKDILKTMKYPKASLYGASYGTRLAQMVMREHPEVVQNAILDSVLPLETKLYNEESAITDYALKALFNGCAAQPECQQAYPNLEGIYSDLTEKLNQEPIKFTTTFPYIGDKETTVNGMDLTGYLIWALRHPEYIRLIPRALHNIQTGDVSFLKYAATLPVYGSDGINMGLFISINCHEQVYATTPEEISTDLAKYPGTEAFALSSIYGNGEALYHICELWQARPLAEGENAPLSSDIPTLIISGTYDPSTPPEFGEQLASRLSRHFLFEFPNGSHVPSISPDPCPVEVASAFLDNPDIQPNPSCWQDTQPIRFIVPYSGDPPLKLKRHTDYQMGIQGLVPAEWKPIGNGFFTPVNSSSNQTMIGQQTDPASVSTWIEWLKEQYNGKIGFDKTPIQVGKRKANNLTWTLYTTTCQGVPVDMAFASSGSQTILILMQSSPDEREAMYETVFLPLVDAALLIK